MDSTNTDKPVGRFLEFLGGAMIVTGFEWLVFVDHPSWVVIVGFWGTGTIVFFAGAFWNRLKFQLPERLVTSVETVALDFRYWMALIFAVWFYMFCVSLLQRRQIVDQLDAMNNEARSFHADLSNRVEVLTSELGGKIKLLRNDLDHYAMPRQLEPDKLTAISNYLQKFPPHTIAICDDGFDTEASNYASQITSALFNGGWTINNCPDPAEDLRKQITAAPNAPVTSQQLWSLWNLVSSPFPKIEGLQLEVERSSKLSDELNKQRHPDAKNPDIEVLLLDALGQGGVSIGQRGGGSLPPGANADEIATLRVGPRPRR
jgi:hypothetical protein